MKKESNAAPIYVPPKSGAKELLKPIWLIAIGQGQYNGRVIYPGEKFLYAKKVKYVIDRDGKKVWIPPHWTELADMKDNEIIVKEDKPSKSPKAAKVEKVEENDAKPLNAKDLSAKIKASDDVTFVEAQLKDERSTVVKAAQARLEELKGSMSASDFV